uniref:glutathione transferase (Fragments) n=1 Tax=Rattus norvegicus TaxID=10116 RepID=Q7M0B6_RAT
MVLGYWDIRGLAHAIRMLLEFTDTSYEEKQVTGEAPDYDMGDTEEEKLRVDMQLVRLYNSNHEQKKPRMFEPKLDEFPNLKAFMCRFEALEKIAAFLQSDRFMMAKWGNK